MNPEAQEQLDKILAKDADELTRDERDFLRARQSYLKKTQVEEYKSVLGAKEAAEKVAPEGEPTVPEHLQPPIVAYNELYRRAKELGYKGRRVSRGALDKFIEEKSQ